MPQHPHPHARALPSPILKHSCKKPEDPKFSLHHLSITISTKGSSGDVEWCGFKCEKKWIQSSKFKIEDDSWGEV